MLASVANGDFDLLLHAVSARASVQDRVGAYLPNSSTNWGRYTASKVTSLAQQAMGELDETRRAVVLNEIDAQLWADVVTIPLYSIPDLAVSTDHVLGVTIVAGALGPLSSARSWR